MTSDQAAQLLQQQQQLMAIYNDLAVVLNTVVHDIFPACCVAFACWLGVVFGQAATA